MEHLTTWEKNVKRRLARKGISIYIDAMGIVSVVARHNTGAENIRTRHTLSDVLYALHTARERWPAHNSTAKACAVAMIEAIQRIT